MRVVRLERTEVLKVHFLACGLGGDGVIETEGQDEIGRSVLDSGQQVNQGYIEALVQKCDE